MQGEFLKVINLLVTKSGTLQRQNKWASIVTCTIKKKISRRMWKNSVLSDHSKSSGQKNWIIGPGRCLWNLFVLYQKNRNAVSINSSRRHKTWNIGLELKWKISFPHDESFFRNGGGASTAEKARNTKAMSYIRICNTTNNSGSFKNLEFEQDTITLYVQIRAH